MKLLRAMLLALTLLGVFLFSGCTSNSPSSQSKLPKYSGGQEAKLVELGAADFESNPHLMQEVALVRPGSLIVSLETGTDAGFTWAPAEVSSPVVTENSRTLTTPVAGPDPAAPTAAVRDVWVFDSAGEGTGMVRFVYGPVGADETAHWTLTLYVTVE